ncbi:MAG: hypothetical protein FWG64_09600 [Firmicutes bacterium]|nr:hypothetical protein [Bacillota bacterium]
MAKYLADNNLYSINQNRKISQMRIGQTANRTNVGADIIRPQDNWRIISAPTAMQ